MIFKVTKEQELARKEQGRKRAFREKEEQGKDLEAVTWHVQETGEVQHAMYFDVQGKSGKK